MPPQLTSMPLAVGSPVLRQRWENASGTRFMISLKLPTSTIPRMETRKRPNQMRKNWMISVKMADIRPLRVT